MRTTIILISILLLLPFGSSYSQSGISIGAGFANEVDMTISASYYHSTAWTDLNLTGGYSLLGTHPSTTATDGVDDLSFGQVQQVFLGFRLGNHFFVLPRLSYSWYGRYESPGWGVSGGVIANPTKLISVGISVNYDKVRFDSKLEHQGPTQISSMHAIVGLTLPY